MNLQEEVTKRAKIFKDYLKLYMQEGEPAALYNAARHLPLAGGKRLRPVLSMLSCESVSADPKQVLPFALALELMHNFTLVHDDIMDKSQVRRGCPAVHVKYGEPTAILAGDFLFARSFEAMHNLTIDLSIFKELNQGLVDCILDICKGQQLDMEFEQRKTVSENEYLKMIEKKTAVLFQLAARGGAIIGGGTQQEISALTDYGLNLGLGFQIWDDYLDMSSNIEILGKDIGNDIRNGKKTLIAVHSLQNVSTQDKAILDDSFGNKSATDDEIKKVFSIFKNLGSIDYAKQRSLDFIEKAKVALIDIRESAAKEILIELADYSIHREK
jgi:geranylgeranyl diphosphate synthase type I